MAALHGAKVGKKQSTITDADIDSQAYKANIKIEDV